MDMGIGIIGLGKLGCSLAVGLKKEGYIISGLYSKSADSVKFANAKLDTNFENSLVDTVEKSEIVFITVPDSSIVNVVMEISSGLSRESICNKVFIHCSGALSSHVLELLEEKGAYTGSLHPVQTFADKETGWKGLYGIYYGFEGNNRAYEIIKPIILSFKGKVLNINEKYKSLYHAAACIVSNYFVTLAYIAGHLFESIGAESDEGIKALKPLIEKTLYNIDSLGPVNALTGPISRGDIETVAGHIEAIKEKNPEILDVYKALGRITVEIGLEKGTIHDEQAELLKRLLD
ncbi:MAG: DUF2520 domain-containing protein [Firmicutes bacterium]|nr:DUF2520 domain-containing protein [Bacillota bacterium]